MNASQAKDWFFDRSAVTDRLSAALRKQLSRLGAFVRQRARSSLRYGKGTARPGRPPVVHRSGGYVRQTRSRKTGQVTSRPASPLRDLIYFGYDPATESVVAGPVVGGPQSGAPERLEGGTGVRPHPFMRPALDAERDRAAGLMRDMVR